MSASANPDIVDDGLVLCLDAGDPKSYAGSGATWNDRSGNEGDATLYNSPTFTTNNGGSLNFDGGNNWGKTSSTTILNSSAYTKIAWFRPQGITRNIISGGGSSQHAFWMGNTNHTLYAGHNGSWYIVSYRPNASGDMVDEWWCGAVTFNSTTGWVLYMNGIQVDTNSSTTTNTGNGIIRIGAYNDADNLFNGDINIVQVYNRVLTADEILQNFNAQKGRFDLT
jgi:hypothetical protein